MIDYVTANERLGISEKSESMLYKVCFTVIIVGLVGIIIAL